MSDNRGRQSGFERFKELARDDSLAPCERVGFSPSVREGKEQLILEDIRSKLTNLDATRQTVVDIGAGCSDLVRLLIDHCESKRHHLVLVDSEEMLARVPDRPFVTKVIGSFPRDCQHFMDDFRESVDALISYSVIQYVFADSSLFAFFDGAVTLLRSGGQFIAGDIPNSAMRKRFLSSENGIRFHQHYMNTTDPPAVRFNTLDSSEIDDAVLLSIMMRYRAAGFHTFLLPQRPDLPMANRREDLLITKP